jgi:hypothetical protein
MLTTTAPGFQGQLQRLTDEQRDMIRTGLIKALARYASGPAPARVGTAAK